MNTVSTLLSGLQAQGVKVANAARNIASADVLGYQAVTTQMTASGDGGVVARTVPLVPVQDVNIDMEVISSMQASQAYKSMATMLSRVGEMQDALLNAVDKNA
ncbi:MAG: hypothetical protein V4621_01275 [Pseudomonadota bacterium]